MKVEDFETYEPKNSQTKTSNYTKKKTSTKNKRKDCSLCGESVWKNKMPVHVKTYHEQNCHLCYKFFETEDELTSHISSEHHREKKKSHLSCAICENWKTGWKTLFHRHITTSHKDLLCCKDYEDTKQLYNHIFENHANFHCLICEAAVFHNYENLKEHMKLKHDMEYQCPTCHLFFESDSELGSHRSTKHLFAKNQTPKKDKYNCNICQAEYKSYPGLKKHKETVHENKVWFCPTCGKKFIQENTLNLHVATNCGKDGQQNRCSMCNKQFESRMQWIEHVDSSHKDIKLYDCPTCKFKCLTKGSLREHIRSAHEHAYVCSFCGKNYANQNTLREHVSYIHGGKKKVRLNCTMCEVTFAHPMSLKKHIESVHEGKKHQCSYCGEIFDTNHLLETHIAFTHDRSKLFECLVCKAGFRTKTTLQNHVNFVHEKTGGHICSACGKSYATKGEVKKHFAMIHELIKYDCDICNKSFSSKQGLRGHVESAHEGKKPSVECPMCSKCFQTKQVLKRHINNVHEKKRPHGCDLCGLRFAQKSQLVTHVKGKHKSVE